MKPNFKLPQGKAAVPAFTAALLAAGLLTSVRAQVQTAGTLFVNVDATALAEGSLTSVTNSGTLGGVFAATGPTAEAPRIATTGGTKGIQFDGNDYLQHMTAVGGTPIFAPEGVVGENPTRSIEVWALNPEVAGEETLVSWGHRGGGPDGSNMSFNYGSDFRWGAVGHWGNGDLGWNNQGGNPPAGRWHHLVYTYDGTSSRVYSDGVQQNGEFLGTGAIVTHADTTILIGAQTEGDGIAVTPGLRFTGTIGRVRVHDGVLTPAQILNNYSAEKAAFVDPVTPPPVAVTAARLTKAPVHRYSFNETAGDATAKTFSDSAGTANGNILGEGATFSGTRLVLAGGPSSTAAYGDLPNGLLSSNAVANGGSGGFTFETWARFTGSRTWSRVFDFGSSGAGIDNGEVTEPGGSGNGLDYFMLSAQIGGDVTTRRFETRDNENTGDESELSDIRTTTFNTDTHLVATWNEATGEINLYENGVRTGGFITDNKMSDINDVNVWLGRSNWMADENAQVEYDEVRLYDYALTAGQALGNAQAGPNRVNLTQDEPVTIAVQPQSVTGVESGTAQFQITSAGSSPISIQWFRGGTAIPGATGPILSLTNLSGADNAAVFTAVLSNTVNGSSVTVTSAPVTLNVQTPVVTLKNRYSFNEASGTTVADSVGGKNGTIVGTATFGGGQLMLDGETAYVDLPNGIVSALGSDGTIEFWATQQSSSLWSRIFDFGISDAGEDAQGGGTDFLFFTPRSGGDGVPRFIANFPGGGDVANLVPGAPGGFSGDQRHVVVSWSASGNTSRVFVDGVLVASGPAPRPLSDLVNQDVNNWLGRSQFAADANWGGKYNEFRLYSGAMGPSQALASFTAGPDATQSTNSPVSLKTSVTGNNLVLSWDASATGYVLESASTLGSGANWTAVNGVTTNGNQMQASVPMQGRAQFFRLRKP